MQKLRVFSKSKEKDSPHSTLEKPSTPKFRDFSLNLTRSNSNSNLNVNFTPPSSPIPSTLESGGKLSPELAPIVSLLTAQSHRKYSEGIFMLLKDLDSDGNPSDRKWIEVYGIMIGNELAYWDSDQLESVGSAVVGDKKPSYLNFSDGTFKTCPSLPSANGNIDNVIVLSTTLKNRFLLQFSSDEDFINWSLAFRLSAYEYKSLQEAYTASLLSARGSLLSDIRVILSEKKFDYEDWTSVRFGAGMPWKRCFAVIEPSKKTRKGFKNGNIYFYDNEKKNKKLLMAKITNISSVYALYPRTYTIIDKSTMIKLEGSIQFDVKENSKDCSIFLMPEQHTSVPGYDTLIRFLIPLMDSFNLYGRPKKLNADKLDPNSLLFGLPVLPKVHYLELKDLKSIINKSSASLDWDQHEWNTKIKEIIKVKINNGYTGCGSSDGINGALDLLNSSKDLATGKVKFFVSKPEVNKYLENSPHAKGLTKFQTSSDEFTVNSSTTPLSQNASKNKFNDLESDRNDSLYSKSRSEFSNTPGPLLPSQTPLQSEEGVLPKTSPSPQVVNIYQKYSQIPDSEKLNSNNLSNSFNDLRIEDHSPKKQSTENELYPSHGGLYGNEEDDDDDDDDDTNEDDDDDDEDDSSFDFIIKKDNAQDRIFSPFTDFNNNVRNAMNVPVGNTAKSSSPVRNITPINSDMNNTNTLKLPKQRSSQRETPLDNSKSYETMNADANRYLLNTNVATNKSNNLNLDYSANKLYSAPLNPYLNKQESPHTPIDQQHPPMPSAPMKVNYNNDNRDGFPNYGGRQQLDRPPPPPAHEFNVNSPTGNGVNRVIKPTKNMQYTNSPELKPPHQYKPQHQPQPQPQLQLQYPQQPISNFGGAQRSASNPLNSPSVTSFGVYGPMKSHSPQMNQQGFQNNNRSFSGPGTNQGRSNAPGPNYSTGYNHQPSHQQGFNNTNHAYPPPQQQQQQQQNYQHQHHHQNYQQHQQQHQQHQVLPPQQNGYPSQQQQQGYYNGNSQYQQNYGQPVPPQLQYGQAPPTAGNRGARYRQPPPQMQQPQSGKSFKHDPYALAKLN